MTIKCYIIDPEAHSLSTEWIKDEEKYCSEMYQRLVGYKCIDVVVLDNDNIMIANDVGLFVPNTHIFDINGHKFAGKCLVFGQDEEGETVSVKMTLPQLYAIVNWTDLEFSHMETSEGTSTHPMFGDEPVFTVINKAMFKPRGS